MRFTLRSLWFRTRTKDVGWKGVSFKSGTYSGIRGSLGHAVIVEFQSHVLCVAEGNITKKARTAAGS